MQPNTYARFVVRDEISDVTRSRLRQRDRLIQPSAYRADEPEYLPGCRRCALEHLPKSRLFVSAFVAKILSDGGGRIKKSSLPRSDAPAEFRHNRNDRIEASPDLLALVDATTRTSDTV